MQTKSDADATSQRKSTQPQKAKVKTITDEGEASEVIMTVEYQELADENEELTYQLEKANKEIQRLRDNLCDVSDIVV